jgi:cytochrome c-type biogenesis protein CcmE
MRKRLIIGGIILLLVIVYLLYLSLSSSVAYYVTVSEFYERGAELHDTNIRIAGKIADSPVVWDAEARELRFTITEGGKTLQVVYGGPQPAGMKSGSNLLVEGKYSSGSAFRATQLIIKCPSKYESIEIE